MVLLEAAWRPSCSRSCSAQMVGTNSRRRVAPRPFAYGRGVDFWQRRVPSVVARSSGSSRSQVAGSRPVLAEEGVAAVEASVFSVATPPLDDGHGSRR